MTKLEKIDKIPAGLRKSYLDSLTEPQELFLELQVDAGQVWRIGDTAYAVVCAGKLVEYHVTSEGTNDVVDLFNAVIKASNVSTVLCKSYDEKLLRAALSRAGTVTTAGLLFRRCNDRSFVPRDKLSFRTGTVSDAEEVFGFNDDFFLNVEEIQGYAESDGLFVLERDKTVIGCGIGKPVIRSRPDMDIGMLVAAEHRRQGHGSHIIAFLKDHYLRQGLRPICGCSVDNIGSQRALTAAGFVCEHRLLRISFDE